MPRVARSSITSKYIHVITQGIKKEYIFKNNEYKLEYIKLLNRVVEEFNSTKILVYCIMDNHAHLLIYTENVQELSKIMSRVNTSYGIFYNGTKNRVGYVFRNRYYTQEIMNENHLFNTVVYIHKNPVKAKIVEKEMDYKYSSYNNYIQNKVNKEIVKLIFDEDNYINKFYFIHKNFSEENIIDIKEEQECSQQKIKDIITKFCCKYNYNLQSIKKDNYLLMLLVKEIKNNSEITNKEITEYIGIGKNRITKLLKENSN